MPLCWFCHEAAHLLFSFKFSSSYILILYIFCQISFSFFSFFFFANLISNYLNDELKRSVKIYSNTNEINMTNRLIASGAR